MKAYLKKMVLRWLSVIVILSSGFTLMTHNVNHYDTVNTIHKAKAEIILKRKAPEMVDTQDEDNQQVIAAAQPVNQPVASAPSIGANNIQIAGVLARNLMKDETGDNLYLNHDINGNYDGIGVPYIDYRTDFNTRKTIIYAHSSTSGNGPFQPLQNYHYNKGYYDAHRFITVNYNGAQYTYEIFSVYVSVADSEESEGLEYFHRMYYDDLEWENTLQRYKNNSDYDTGVSVSASDKILILQTCSMDPNYYMKHYRSNLVIMGKLI